MLRPALSGLCILLLSAAAAHADPCTAVPDKGPTPATLKRGATFSGEVTYVGDGDSLCVALGPRRNQWVEVRLADFYAPELGSKDGPAAKAALIKIAKGKRATCRAGKRSYDRIVARCTIEGRAIEEMLRRAGVAEGGRGQPAARSTSFSSTKSAGSGASVARQ
jgi:endonuclease YncB( thermonuclease family)